MTERRWITAILVLFLLLGITYAFTTPPFEASDELWHYPMVRHLADGNPLPVQVFDPALAGPWKQEASQPPLYYYLGAALTFWIDTSDMAEVRLENPHVNNGLITQDGNTNLTVHDPQSNPWQGTLLAVRLVRLLSVLMGTITVYLTYRIARSAMPGRTEVALGAAAVNAFLPMFLFISGSVNNDNLAILLASLSLYMMIFIVTGYENREVNNNPVRYWQQYGLWVLLGILIGLALLTKEGTIGLLPLAWGTCFIYSWLEKENEEKESAGKTIGWLLAIFLRSIAYFMLVLLPTTLIAGWWYWRNIQLYGDWLGWSAFIAVLGERAHPASLLQLWGERRGFLMAYWGLYGGVNIPMPDWVYTIFNSLLVISVFGFILAALLEIRTWLQSRDDSRHDLQGAINNILRFIVDHFALVIALIFSSAVVIGLIRWATTTWSSQGRLVFTAFSALCTLFVVGLVGWMPQRIARWTMSGIALYFFLIALAAPFLWIKPAYDPASYNLAQGADFEAVGAVFGERMRLNQASIELEDGSDGSLQPGYSFWVHLDWEVLAPMEENWSVFVHAVDPILGRPIAQRDMYLGQGLRLTSWLEPGTRLINSYHIQLPETVVSPADLEIVSGLYNLETGERLTTADDLDAVTLGTVHVITAEGTTPNPTHINFENQFELAGYTVAPRSVRPGETIELTLYLQPLQPMENDYTFFAQVVDENTTRWASIDFMPPEGTSSWPQGEVQTVSLSLTLASDTPADVYPLILGAYTRDSDSGFNRLQILTPDGRLTDDFLELTQVRVE
ncbi:MAG: glycosyltransferase family 39 protein [Candidatus Promineifilaceae bacterium]|jgi:hypothetical protein